MDLLRSNEQGKSFHSASCFLWLCFQSKKKFERECKEAEKSQITFERLDNDVNATKSDVERVRLTCSTCVYPSLHPKAPNVSFLTLCNILTFTLNSKGNSDISTVELKRENYMDVTALFRPRTSSTSGRTQLTRARTSTPHSCRTSTQSSGSISTTPSRTSSR